MLGLGKIFPSLFCMLLVLSSCKVKTPKGIIPHDEMERLLYDYHEAQAMAENGAAGKVEVYTEAVLMKYGVTRDEFNASMRYYSRHADELYDIYDRIGKRFQNDMRGMGTVAETGNEQVLSEVGDTANIWRGARSMLLTPEPASNLFTFRMNADTSFRPKDRFEWHFTTKFVYKEGRKSLQAAIAVVYEGDSMTIAEQPVYGEGDNVLTLQASSLPIRRIEGFIYLDEPEGSDAKLCFISRMSIVRYHEQHEPEKTTITPADSAENAREAEKKSFIDSVQRSSKDNGGDHFKSVTRGREMPHQKR